MEDDWREGQKVEALRVVKTWKLSAREAEEMNAGENPLYPWRVDRFCAVVDRPPAVRQQERDLKHLAAMIEDGDHADKADE